VFNLYYNLFKVSLIILSAEISGFSNTILLTSFTEDFLLIPKTSNADNASSLLVLFEEANPSSKS